MRTLRFTSFLFHHLIRRVLPLFIYIAALDISFFHMALDGGDLSPRYTMAKLKITILCLKMMLEFNVAKKSQLLYLTKAGGE
ncbi:hypothetical protein PF050_21840 [Kosakonia pseudosacchari]|uniref:hypothetical protein n=1 Tax=Kosakonia pseudosacchari TaxID=1646340 RepID=UPI0022F1046C|nr:hypothetical protein [Kosakonia pseudosacchari]WBU49050.1 hypothetical protein PF050_21840 [Kosakonia pseudosacchari]